MSGRGPRRFSTKENGVSLDIGEGGCPLLLVLLLLLLLLMMMIREGGNHLQVLPEVLHLPRRHTRGENCPPLRDDHTDASSEGGLVVAFIQSCRFFRAKSEEPMGPSIMLQRNREALPGSASRLGVVALDARESGDSLSLGEALELVHLDLMEPHVVG